ncbi:MAG: chaperone NapD [Magnetospirillum sp.]|nr:chaperone NapD [Magnetospirillum sp.]
MRLNSFVSAEKSRPHTELENICGVLVHAKPAELKRVSAALVALPGVEIHQSTAEGKLVVTVEDADGVWAGATISQFNEIEGVLSVALVYHHFDTDLEGEIVP